MKAKEKAFEIFGKDFKEFEEIDPYNNNRVEGFICLKHSQFYGSLLLSKVNGYDIVPKLIMGTPKMHYPIDRNGKYIFPSAKKIEAYEKLDGTNIVAYHYFDHENNRYLTYKTRLMPLWKSKIMNL